MRILWLAEERRRIEQRSKEAYSLPLFLEEELEAYEQSPSSTTRSIGIMLRHNVFEGLLILCQTKKWQMK
jgi:hypothetical protein